MASMPRPLRSSDKLYLFGFLPFEKSRLLPSFKTQEPSRSWGGGNLETAPGNPFSYSGGVLQPPKLHRWHNVLQLKVSGGTRGGVPGRMRRVTLTWTVAESLSVRWACHKKSAVRRLDISMPAMPPIPTDRTTRRRPIRMFLSVPLPIAGQFSEQKRQFHANQSHVWIRWFYTAHRQRFRRR